MSNKFNFTTDRSTGGPDLSNASLARFAAAIPGNGTNFTVSREIASAAEEELLKRTRALAFETREPFFKCLNEVIQCEPRLTRLVYARVCGVVHAKHDARNEPDVGVV